MQNRFRNRFFVGWGKGRFWPKKSPKNLFFFKLSKLYHQYQEWLGTWLGVFIRLPTCSKRTNHKKKNIMVWHVLTTLIQTEVVDNIIIKFRSQKIALSHKITLYGLFRQHMLPKCWLNVDQIWIFFFSHFLRMFFDIFISSISLKLIANFIAQFCQNF